MSFENARLSFTMSKYGSLHSICLGFVWVFGGVVGGGGGEGGGGERRALGLWRDENEEIFVFSVFGLAL